MRIISRRLSRGAAVLGLLACVCAFAQEPKPAAATAPTAKDAAKDNDKSTDKAPPLPPDAHVTQSIQLNGKTLSYNVTVGTLPVYEKDGKKSGEVVFTAYIVEGPGRSVAFALNGGPGASSVFLNFGAIGPKHIRFGEQGDSPSDPASLSDNPGTWLDFTDLVFIDPIGTGFSRSLVSAGGDEEAVFHHRSGYPVSFPRDL